MENAQNTDSLKEDEAIQANKNLTRQSPVFIIQHTLDVPTVFV